MSQRVRRVIDVGTGICQQGSGPIRLLAYADDLVDVVDELVAQLKLADPMAPVIVLLPSGAACRSMSLAMSSKGLFNVDFSTMHRLVGSICTSLARPDRLLLDRHIRRELTRQVANEARAPLGSVAATGATFVEELLKAFDDLGQRSEAEIERIADSSPMAHEIVRLYLLTCQRTAQFVGAGERHAIAAVGAHLASTPVITVLVDPPTNHESLVLQALTDARRLRTVLLQTGHSDLDSSLETATWGLGLLDNATARPCELRPDKILVAPDPVVEVQSVVSELLAAAAHGVPFAKMAVLASRRAPYESLLISALGEAGIAFGCVRDLPPLDTTVGRFCTSFLDMVEEGLSARSLFRWLSSAPLRNPRTGQPIPASDWSRIARAARVDGDPAAWRTRLESLEQVYVDQSRADQAEMTGSLADFHEDLASFIEGPPAGRLWGDWSQLLAKAIRFYLDADSVSKWPETVQARVASVHTALVRLGDLDMFESRPTVADFSAALVAELMIGNSAKISPGSVTVATLDDAVGASFDFVAVCGASETYLPTATRLGPLVSVLRVPDQEPARDRQRRAFTLALAASSRSVVTMSRSDPSTRRELRPSPWLLECAQNLAGVPITSDQLTSGGPLFDSWLTVVPSFSDAVASLEYSVSALWDRLRSAESSILEGPGHAAIKARGNERATRFDGVIGPMSDLFSGVDRSVSPTSLEDWALCPYRYFLKNVLGLKDEAVDIETFATSPLERGQIVHRVLEELVRKSPERTEPSQPWSDGERELAHNRLDQLYDESTRLGRSPMGLLSEIERRSQHDHLDVVLDLDHKMRSTLGVAPSMDGAEVSFDSVVVRRPQGEPVLFKGRIDRVDRSPDGKRFVVTDYKTGKAQKSTSLDTDCVERGTRLQAAIYGCAIAEQNPGAEIRSGYWYVNDSRSGYARQDLVYDQAAASRLSEVVDTVVRGIETGVFPAVPGPEDRDSYFNCRRCSFDKVCPVDRSEAWERKSHDVGVEAFTGLQVDQRQ